MLEDFSFVREAAAPAAWYWKMDHNKNHDSKYFAEKKCFSDDMPSIDGHLGVDFSRWRKIIGIHNNRGLAY